MRLPLVLALLLLSLLSASLSASGSPNAREDALPTEAPVLDVAIAHGAVADGRMKFASAAEDTASQMDVEGAHLPTWRAWDLEGDQVRAGDTDRTNCQTRVEDDCIGDTVGVALSDDGRRLVAMGEIDPLTLPIAASDNTTQLVFVDAQQGIIARLGLNATGVALDMSGNGQRVAVVLREGTTTVTGRLVVIDFPANSAVNVVKDLDLDFAPAGVAIDAKGTQVGVWGDAYVQYAVGGVGVAGTSADTDPATDGAFSGGDDPLAVVGFERGLVALYPETVSGGDKVPVYSRQPTTSDITSVAITRDGTLFVAGDASGSVHVFGSSPLAFLGTHSIGTGPVRDVAVTNDGRYLALQVGEQVRFMAIDGSALTTIWQDDLGAVGRALVMDGTGDHLTVAVGEGLRVYDADRRVEVTGSPRTIKPAENATFDVTVRNPGNRHAEAALLPDAPLGWGVSTSPTDVVLAPGESKKVALTVRVPAGTAPGAREVYVNASLAGGGAGTGSIRVTVPEVRALVLASTDSRSIAIEPGAPGAFQLELRNEGNVAGSASFDLDAPSGWQAAVTPPRVDLEPGQSSAVEVSVLAPEDAPDGTAGTFTLAVAGDPDSAVELTATAGARFDVALSLPKGFQAAIGNATPFTLTVTNQGNAIDTIDLAAGPMPTGWRMSLPSGLESFPVPDLAPGETRDVSGTITVGQDAVIGERHVIEMTATSRADTGKTASDSMLVTVGEAAEVGCPAGRTPADDGTCVKKRSPGVALPAALVGLALLAVLARRR